MELVHTKSPKFMTNLVVYLGDNPKVGLIIASLHLWFATNIHAINLWITANIYPLLNVNTIDIPENWMHFLQAGAWIMTMICSAITATGWIEKRFKKFKDWKNRNSNI